MNISSWSTSEPYPPLEAPVAGPEGFPVAGMRDLAVMKLVALSQRGLRRDFWDLYAILQSGMSLPEIARDYLTRTASKRPICITSSARSRTSMTRRRKMRSHVGCRPAAGIRSRLSLWRARRGSSIWKRPESASMHRLRELLSFARVSARWACGCAVPARLIDSGRALG